MTIKILCLDLGNTRVKWGVFSLKALEIEEQGVLEYRDDLAAVFQQMVPMPVWVSAVSAADKTDKVAQWFKVNWQTDADFVRASAEFDGLINAYVSPDQLGVDRWLAMIAARSLFDQDVCIVDAGTALTIDVVTRDGQHRGGMILPGKNLIKESLMHGTENINTAQGSFSGLADNTIDAVTSGAEACWLGGVERSLEMVRLSYPECIVVVTGGDSSEINSVIIDNVYFKKDLVLLGVGLMARKFYA